MANSWCFFALIHIFWLSFGAKYIDEPCERIRRPIHSLTEDERLLYVRGFQALRKSGKLDKISLTHAQNIDIHLGSSFFFYHAYLIWEAETQIRALGDEFKCFSMPYWDFTIDSGLETNPPIFEMNIGDKGSNIQTDYCVNDDTWSVNNYWTSPDFPLTCMDDETKPYCCLKRDISESQLLPNAMDIASVFVNNQDFVKFENQINFYHNWPHMYLAINTRCTMATAFAPDDPLFFLLHTFTIYQRALFTKCNAYDTDDIINNLDAYPNAYSSSCNFDGVTDCGETNLDDPYTLHPLSAFKWSFAAKKDITPRMMYNIKDWNIKYDLGTFYVRSKLNEWCSPIGANAELLNDDDWFVDLTGDSSIAIKRNYLQNYIDDTWTDIKQKQTELEIDDIEVYQAVESLTCKYHRSNSLNSCYYDDGFLEDDIDYDQYSDLCDNNPSLDDMLSFDYVQNNECLQQRRREIYPVINYDKRILYYLCNGEYDYKCTEWNNDKYKLYNNKQMFNVGVYGAYYSTQIISVLLSILIFVAIILIHRYLYKSDKNDMNKELEKTVHNVNNVAMYGTFYDMDAQIDYAVI